MRARLSLALTALVLLFLLEGQRVFFSVLFGLTYDAIFPGLRPARLLLALLPLTALLAPLLPLSRGLSHRAAVAVSVGAAAVLRVALFPPGLAARAVCSALVIAAGALFLFSAVGTLERRSVSAGAASAFVLDQLAGLAGWSYDVTLRPAWLPVQVVLSLILLALLAIWLRLPEEEGEEALERRAGGLRLRGALALGTILFFQTNALAAPVVGARWTGVSYPVMAVLLSAAGAVAVAMLLGGRGPAGRHRPAAVTLAALMLAAVLVPWVADGWGPALLFAVGGAAGLILLDRSLAPAGGRRGGWVLVLGLGVQLVLGVAYALTFFYAFTLPALRGGAPWVFLAAGVFLTAALLVVPRPAPSLPLLPWRGAALVALGTSAAAALLAWLGAAAGGRAPGMAGGAAESGSIGVATYNLHYGFDEGWRYDPEALARVVETSGADIVALQEVPAGLLLAYGTDHALWLARRLGMSGRFAPSINGLLGDAVLSRLPVIGFESRPLPPAHSDRKQLAALDVRAPWGTLRVYGTHFGVTAEDQREQVAATLARLRPGPAVLTGDLNVEPGSEVTRRIEQAGFRDAFALAGAEPAPTAPARRPRMRIDWVWLRGYEATEARVLDHTASDHRLVLARLKPMGADG